jgi:AcrR family transcriptional regulator
MPARNLRRDPRATRSGSSARRPRSFRATAWAARAVDRIATRAGANKRMLYYYYGNKEALFLAVLESRYAHIRRAEQGLRLGDLTRLKACGGWSRSPGTTT